MPRSRSVVLTLLLAVPLHAQGVDTAAVNRLFARYATDSTPGCAIGIARGGDLLYSRGYGMADLERNVPLTAASVIEAGSVSKQVTAAAVLLLAARGFLSLDDNILHFFPELHDYGTPITVRHLMQHSSGLRDWGAMAELEGWPRGTRTATQSDVLAILARQRHLNHTPGAKFSYTNSGYNLLVMLVERVTAQSFPAFTAREFFTPLGMTHTQWRDDYARIVPGRAQAYSRRAGRWVLDMPFENAYGNGGLLTTVEDLLIWTNAIATQRIGSPDVSAVMQTPGKFNDGTPSVYGGGLSMITFRGVQEVSHSGATAGYRTFLARYPESGYAVAVLCTAGDANSVALAHDAIAPLARFAAPVAMTTATRRPAPKPPAPTKRALQALTGTWTSAEAAARWEITLRNDTLRVSRRPGDDFVLRPTLTDQFSGDGAMLRFIRGGRGNVTGLLVTIPRAVEVAFSRVAGK